jgi:hypothetical protein
MEYKSDIKNEKIYIPGKPCFVIKHTTSEDLNTIIALYDLRVR